jgi:hypothetical protein
LLAGIKINSFSFGDFSVSQFYIKLNKKLIVNIEKITYTSKKSQTINSFEDIKKDIELLPKVLKIFERINIERFLIDGNEFTIQLNDEMVYLDNKFVNISSKIDIVSNQVVLDLYSIYLKDINLLLLGKVKIDYFNEKVNYFGKYKKDDITGNLKIDATKSLMNFYLDSESFKNLKFIKDYIDLDKDAEAWMYDNVKGDITLKEFYGSYDLKNNKVLMKSLNGKASISNAKISFHKDVEALDVKQVDINYDNDELSFNLIEPKYKKTAMDGSNVIIHNLTSLNKGEVEINIKAKTTLNKDIHQILKAFKLNIPITQKSGITNANLKLIVPYLSSKKMITKGEFEIKNALIAINDFEFTSKEGKILVDDNIVNIKNTGFKYQKMIDAIVSLKLDTKTLQANGNAKIKSLYISSEDEILNIKNIETPLKLDFNNTVSVKLDKLKTNLLVKDLVYINIDDLSLLYPYSKLLKDNSLKGGALSLSIKDENNLTFKGKVSGLNYPISNDSKSITSLSLNGFIKNGDFEISSSDNLVKIEKSKNQTIKIKLKNIDINLKDEGSSSLNEFPKVDIDLENSNLILKDDIYSLKNAKIKLNPKIIYFDASVKNLDLPLKKDGKLVEELELKGSYTKEKTEIYTYKNDLNLILKDDDISVDLNGYDILYNTDLNEGTNGYKNFNLTAKKSRIIMNDKYKFLSDALEIRLREKSKFLHLQYKQSDITFKENSENGIDIFASDVKSEFINAIFDKEILSDGNYMLLAKGDINNLDGKVIIENSKVEDLAILNNLLLFIHTSPALINPLLAVPSVVGMATNGGFNLSGYKIINGNIEFNYSKEKENLNIKKLVTVGNGIDFDGQGDIDLSKMTLQSKIKMIFLKDYSKIVGAIPIVNYVLLGDNNRVETQVDVFGPLNNPKISTNLTKDTFSVPVNIAKRLLQSPAKLLDFLNGQDNIDNQEPINKPKE